MIEISWLGRGGQGVKTAALLFTETVIKEGKYCQGFPDFGPERSGAPVRGYNRIDDKEIRIHSKIENPDIGVVLDPSLLGKVDILAGLKEGGTVLINTDKDADTIAKKLGVTGRKVFTVNATGIALKEIGRPIPNTPMMAALAKVTGVIKLETLTDLVKEKFAGKYSDKVIEGNLRAVERAYKEVKGNA